MTIISQLRALEGVDTVGRNKAGNYVLRRGYYWGVTKDGSEFAESMAQKARAAGLNVDIVDSGNHYVAFRGNATVKQGSHWWVELRVTEKEQVTA